MELVIARLGAPHVCRSVPSVTNPVGEGLRDNPRIFLAYSYYRVNSITVGE
jgi:hypothetical protein